MAQVRRPSLLGEGESLLLARSAIGAATRFTAFAEESGLPQPSVLSTPLCAVPLPLYAEFGNHPDGSPRRRWAGTRAEFMWHPLMWLPQRVAGRYRINDPATGQQRLEDDDLWAVRVALELTASGLYDPATGTWFDVLHPVGIDIETPAGRKRVRRWLDGAPDDTLDDVDLSDYLDIDPPSWALESALALRDDLEHASWALIADDLLGLSDQILAPGGMDTRQRLAATQSLARLAESLLSEVPDDDADADVDQAPEPDVPTAWPPARSASQDFAALAMRLRFGDGVLDEATLADLVKGARDRLYVIREAYWSYVESLSELAEGDAVTHDTTPAGRPVPPAAT